MCIRDRLKAALKAVGFYDVVEVAIGADLCTVDEAHDFLEEVPEKLSFMATSCCPAWSMICLLYTSRGAVQPRQR